MNSILLWQDSRPWNPGEALVQAMKTGHLALQRARAMKTDPSVAWIEPKPKLPENPNNQKPKISQEWWKISRNFRSV